MRTSWVAASIFVASVAMAKVPVLTVEGPLGPVTAEYVQDGLVAAAKDGAPAVVLRVDTPGGLERSMRELVQAVLASPVPVVAWVGPAGARAASAGLFVVAAAHVATMAPGTNLGAAHPVALGGGKGSETAERKAESDAVAFIRALAQERGRSPEWFERAVAESASLAAADALAEGVVDGQARDLEELLAWLHGREVVVQGKGVVLHTQGQRVEEVPLSGRQRALRLLSDPNIAYLLLLLGFYGLFFEFSNPGSLFPGVLGGIFLILAFVGLQALPFRYAGVLLIAVGLLLLLLEVKIASFGLLTVGGVLALALGSALLVRTTEAYQRVSLGVMLPAVGATVVFFAFAVAKGLAAQRGQARSGREGLVGERGTALEALAAGRRGRVFVHGEYWHATAGEEIPAGSAVEVSGVEGLELRVRPLRSEEGPAQ